MLTAILIADQQRLHALVAASLGGSGVQLTIISSLAGGIEQATATPPDLLFVQGRLSGLSAEIVSRHVSAHVDQARTRLVIFAEPGEESSLSGSQLYLDLALPDSFLENRIAALVKAAQPSALPVATAAADSDAFIPDPDLAGRKNGHDGAVTAVEGRDASPPPVSQPESSVATRFAVELDTELARREEDQRPLEQPEPKRQRHGQHSVGRAEADELASLSRRRTVATVATVFLLAAAVAVVQLLPASKHRVPDKVPATTVPKPRPAVGTVPPPAATAAHPAQTATTKPVEPLREPLPTFVPADGRDPSYAAANPGWERYQDAKREYKVFWESGKLKALQIIDRSGSGLSPTFFTATMKELAGVRDYQLVSRESKDRFLIKKGNLGRTGRIIIYKNKADSVLQAFVIHFDQGQESRR